MLPDYDTLQVPTNTAPDAVRQDAMHRLAVPAHSPADAALLSVDARRLAILDALARGVTYREIAATYRVGMRTLVTLAQEQAELEQLAIRKVMQTKTLAMLSHWENAALSGAIKGRHEPARDWLQASGAIQADAASQDRGAKVAILIGIPGAPVGGADAQVITLQQDRENR